MTCATCPVTVIHGTSATKQDWTRPRVLSPDEIIRIVSIETGIPVGSITGTSRLERIVEARHLAMFFVKDKTTLKLAATSRIFNRDHTTLLNAISKVRDHYKVEKPYRIKYHTIEWLLDKAARL